MRGQRSVPSISLVVALALGAPASSQVTLTEVATIDLAPAMNPAGPAFIGGEPGCLAWSHRAVFVAGRNSSGGVAEVGIVEITDPFGTPTFGASFGRHSTPDQQGYTGLDDAAGLYLAAAYDSGGDHPHGIALFDVRGTNNHLWSVATRGSSGVAIDPGLAGGGHGIAFTNIGLGRRRLHDLLTGGELFGPGNGMVLETPEGTSWRDIDFDSETGDVYLREGNNVVRCVRSGPNAIASRALLYDASPDNDMLGGHHVARLDGLPSDLVVWNDRASAAPTQDFFAVVRVTDSVGSSVPVDWGSFSPSLGNGHYDFAWCAVSRSLAVLDVSHRRVHLFALSEGLGQVFCLSNPNNSGSVANTSASGSLFAAQGLLTLTCTEMTPNAFGFFIVSRTPGWTPNPGQGPGSVGVLCLGGAIGRLVGPGQIGFSGPQGRIALALDLSQQPTPLGPVPVQAGETWHWQCWFRETGSPIPAWNFSSGIRVTFL